MYFNVKIIFKIYLKIFRILKLILKTIIKKLFLKIVTNFILFICIHRSVLRHWRKKLNQIEGVESLSLEIRWKSPREGWVVILN